jgi:hypothetical protein
LNYRREREDPNTRRTNYMQDAPYAFRIIERKDSHPAERAEAPTAMHLRLRHQSGLYPNASDAMRAATRLLGSKPPLWSRDRGSIDCAYWWQGTEALASSPERGPASGALALYAVLDAR